MAKSAVFLLIIGLAAGLWLGFNPQAHQQTVQKWDSIKSAAVKLMAESNVKIQGVNSHVTTSLQNSPRLKSTPQSQPDISLAWKQVSNAFQAAWISMQRFLANVTAKINTTR
jgi:hypothetical protein